jgi:hypothetical protein
VTLYLGGHVGDSINLDQQKVAPANVIIGGGIVI